MKVCVEIYIPLTELMKHCNYLLLLKQWFEIVNGIQHKKGLGVCVEKKKDCGRREMMEAWKLKSVAEREDRFYFRIRKIVHE